MNNSIFPKALIEYHPRGRRPGRPLKRLLDGVQIETETGHMGLISWWNTTTTIQNVGPVTYIQWIFYTKAYKIRSTNRKVFNETTECVSIFVWIKNNPVGIQWVLNRLFCKQMSKGKVELKVKWANTYTLKLLCRKWLILILADGWRDLRFSRR
jgi:hypothetical protein